MVASSFIKVNGGALRVNGGRLTTPQPTFSQLLSWTDAWDVANAVLYTPTASDQSNYGITSALRVDHIPNTGANALPHTRDSGIYSSSIGVPSFIPGPLYVPASSFFRGGTPSMQFDNMGPGHPLVYSMLSPVTDYSNSATFFNHPSGYAAPFWVAQLGDGIDAQMGSTGAGPTLGTNLAGTFYGVACYNLSSPPVHFINSDWPYNTSNTTLFLYYNSGSGGLVSDSFLEVTTRQTDGQLVSLRTTGPQDNWPWKELFQGWLDNHRYTVALGIKLGTPTENQLTAVRSWAAQYIAVGGSGG